MTVRATSISQTPTFSSVTGSARLIGGGLTAAKNAITVDTTLTAANYGVFVDATAGPVNITLPAAATFAGVIFVVKKVDASANAVTITAGAGDTIDGAATKVLTTQYSSAMVQAIGPTFWYII